MRFSDILVQAIGRDGLKAVANDLGIQEAALSRFQSNQGGLFLDKVDRLLERERYVVMTEKELIRRDQEHMRDRETLRRMCELWIEAQPRR